MKRIFLAILILVMSAVPSFSTVTTETTRVAYTCNGTSTTYAYTFPVLEDADLLVIKTLTATGAESMLALTTDYTVTGSGGTSGNVVLTAGSKCASGYTLTIMRNMEVTQETDYIDGESFSAESLEDALDKSAMIQQQIKEELGRVPKLPKTSTITSIALPTPSANSYIGWNAGATGLSNISGPVVTTATQYEVDALVSYGGGTSYTSATINTALTAIGTDKATLLLRPGAWAITAAVVFPDNVDVEMPTGAILTIATGITVTINGSFDADLSQHFVCVGTGKVAGLKESYPDWFADTQKAMDSITAGGVLSLSGTTTLTSTLTVANSNTTIRGNGDSSILIGAAGVTPLITITGERTVLEKFQLQGIATDETAPTKWGVAVNADNVIIRDMLISGPVAGSGFNIGIVVGSGQAGVEILNNRIERIKGTNSGYGYAVLLIKNLNCIVSGNKIVGTSTNLRHHVYLSQGCEKCIVSNNHLTGGTQSAISIYSTTAQAPNQYNIISGNLISDLTATVGAGIDLTGWSPNNLVSGNFIYGTTASHGILVWNTEHDATKNPSYNQIEGNKIYWVGLSGICVIGSSYNLISGNHILEANHTLPSVSSAIDIAMDGVISSSYTTITGNHCSGTNQYASLNIESGCTNTNATGNYFRAGTFTYAVKGSSTATNSIIKNNLGFITENSGSTAAAATGMVINHGLSIVPTSVTITPVGLTAGDIFVSGVDATSFIINFTSGGNRTFYWTASKQTP